MQAILGELYEAAAVDGASHFRRFWHVRLPGLRHVMVPGGGIEPEST